MINRVLKVNLFALVNVLLQNAQIDIYISWLHFFLSTPIYYVKCIVTEQSTALVTRSVSQFALSYQIVIDGKL